MIISASNIVAMSGYENYHAYVYLFSVAPFGSHTLRVRILNSDIFLNQVCDCELAISPFITLTWYGYFEGKIENFNLNFRLIFT